MKWPWNFYATCRRRVAACGEPQRLTRNAAPALWSQVGGQALVMHLEPEVLALSVELFTKSLAVRHLWTGQHFWPSSTWTKPLPPTSCGLSCWVLFLQDFSWRWCCHARGVKSTTAQVVKETSSVCLTVKIVVVKQISSSQESTSLPEKPNKTGKWRNDLHWK